MDATNLKLLFTLKITYDTDNVNYLRPLLTIDRITHHLYFYNGVDKIFTLNMHGDVLHIQYEAIDRFHSLKIFAGKHFLNVVSFIMKCFLYFECPYVLLCFCLQIKCIRLGWIKKAEIVVNFE